MKTTGTTINSVEAMDTLVRDAKKEINEFCDYLVAEAVRLQKRIEAQIKAEGDEAFAQIYGSSGASAAKFVYGQVALVADRGCSMLEGLDDASDALSQIAQIIRDVRARRTGADALQV